MTEFKDQNTLSLLNRVRNGQSKTAKDVIRENGLDYHVEKVPAKFQLNGTEVTIPDRQVTVRTDRSPAESYLGTVGTNYGVVQNLEQLEFLDEMNKAGDAEFYAAGAPNRGEIIYVVMKTPEYVVLPGNDRIDSMFLLTSSHDGSQALHATPLPVDSNGISILPYGGAGIKVRHTRRVERKMAEAKRIVKKMKEKWLESKDFFKLTAGIKVTDDQAKEYFKILVPDDTTRSENIREFLFDLYNGEGLASSFPSRKGTMFGAFMAVVEYCDRHKTVRKSTHRDPQGAVIHSRLHGPAAALKARAYAGMVKLAGQATKKKSSK